MSNKIDERIVQMEFDNAQFQRGIADTTGALAGLEQALQLRGIGDDVAKIGGKISAMGAIAFAGIAKLTDMALDAGLQMANSLWQPMVEGGKKRALALEQAKFQFRGLGLDVEGTMAAALYAVKGTAFGLDEAATAAGSLGASMVPLEKMPQALRAISGVAALSGSSYSDVADVFTKVAGQGRLMGDDLNRLASRGVNAAATLAKQFGITESEVRDLVGEGKIGFEQFAESMDSAFGENATKASDTFSGASANMRAALSRIGAAFATTDFEKQRVELNAITPAIDNINSALAPVQAAFAEFSNAAAQGTKLLFDTLNAVTVENQLPDFFLGLQNIFNFILAIARPIKAAWDSIFPAATAEAISKMAASFLAFTQNLTVSEGAAAQIKTTFAGFFAIFDIARIIIVRVIEQLVKFFGGVDKGKTDILGFTSNLGEMILKFREALINGTVIADIFAWIGRAADNVKDKLRIVGEWIARVFNFKAIGEGGAQVRGVFDTLLDWLPRAAQWIGEAWGNVIDKLTEVFKSFDPNVFLNLLSTGALAGIVLMIRNFVQNFGDSISGGLVDQLKGVLEAIGGAFSDIGDSVTGTLEAMQNKIKSDMVRQIGIAIAILAASLLILSFIEPIRLTSAMAGIAAAMLLMVGMLAALQKFVDKKELTKISGAIAVITALSVAMVIFSTAILILAQLDWNELARGLTGAAVGMGIMVGAMILLDKMQFKAQGAGQILIISAALVIFAYALKQLGEMSWGEIGAGLTAMLGVLGIVVGAMALFDKLKNAPVGMALLVVISAALFVMAHSLKFLTTISWEEMGRGMTALVGILGALVGAVSILTLLKGSAVGAATMIAMAVAIKILSGSLIQLSKLSWEEIAKALVVLAGGLAILAGAMALMGIPIVLLGAVGLTAAGLALMMIAPALKILGSMSWDDIGRGLTVLAGALAVMAVLGVLLIPALPGFLGLGLAAMLIGTSTVLAGLGLAAMAVGITALAEASTVGIAAIELVLTTIINMIPEMMAAFAQGLIDFALVIAAGQTEFTLAATTLVQAIIAGIDQNGQSIIDTIFNLVMALWQKIVDTAPIFIEGGWAIIIAFLQGIERRIGDVITIGASIIIAVIKGIGQKSEDIITAAANTIVKFLNGVARGIRENSDAFERAGANIFRSIVNGVSNAIENGGDLLAWAGRRIGNAIIEGAKNALSINSPSKVFRDDIMPSVFEGVGDGADRGMSKAEAAGASIGDGLVNAARKSLADLKNAVATDMDFNPTIRPVLDLSNVRDGAGMIPGLLDRSKINLSGQYAEAVAVAASERANTQAEMERRYSENSAPVVRDVKYEQNLYSPEALSEATIYRQSKNGFAALKEAIEKDD